MTRSTDGRTERANRRAPTLSELTSSDRVCDSLDPVIFFPRTQTAAAVEYAKNHCRRCPVRVACLDYALTRSAVGIWGGTTESERMIWRQRLESSDLHAALDLLDHTVPDTRQRLSS